MATKKEFFAKKDAEDMVEELLSFADTWGTGEGGQTSGSLGIVLRNARRNRLAFESMMYTSKSFDQALEFTGDQDELIRMKVPFSAHENSTVCFLHGQKRNLHLKR